MSELQRQVLAEITNLASSTQRPPSPKKADRIATYKQEEWCKELVLEYLWWPLGPWSLELPPENMDLKPIMENNKSWVIMFIKDFSDSWRPGLKYEARLRPKMELCAVGQALFTSIPSLHSCIVLEGRGFLWLNRLVEEDFIRCNWLEDSSASAKILPPLNLCLDLDDTLIFNAPINNSPVSLEYVVKEPPHLLIDDPDPSGEVCSSDSPFVRPYVMDFLQLICPFFRNVRLASFSVQARAAEIARHLDPRCRSIQKNYQPDPITKQKPVTNTIFARELLLQQGHCLTLQERTYIKSGAVFWLKSLEMLDLPQKGLYQRSIILDDRSDVWVQSNQENVVRISGPDKLLNIGDPNYINGYNGGEIGQRILLAFINLELKSTSSRAYREGAHCLSLTSPKRLTGLQRSPVIYPQSPSFFACNPTPTKATKTSLYTPARPNTLAAAASPPNKAPRCSLVTGFSQARDREQRLREHMRERGINPRHNKIASGANSWKHTRPWELHSIAAELSPEKRCQLKVL